MTFADLIKKFGSQLRMADALGCSQTAVSHWARRGSFPKDRLHGVAEALGIDVDAVRHLAHHKAAHNKCDPRRDADFEARYRRGETLEQIGARYGITRERVRQRLAKLGIKGDEGGARVRAAFTEAARIARINARCVKKHGMSWAEYRALMSAGYRSSPQLRYRYQMRTARHRGIEWQFTFASWWQVWQESGKWLERGRGRHGYVMARIGDAGPYSPANVRIILATENVAEYYDRERAIHGRIRSGQERKAA